MSPLTCAFVRAGDRTRTGDPHLGKVMLYQLSHAREAAHYRGRGPRRHLRAPFWEQRYGAEMLRNAVRKLRSGRGAANR